MNPLNPSVDKKPGAARRSFLKGAALAGAALGAGAALARTTAEAPPSAQAADGEAGKGYRETEHIRAYYRSARF